MTQPTPAERALMDVAWVCEDIARNGIGRSMDVTLYRRLRELHRCLGLDDTLDPRRIVRSLLFNGLDDHKTCW